MKNCSLHALMLVILFGCAHGNSGFYNRDTNDTYSLQVGGAVENPKYSVKKGAYEICKKDHGKGGYELLKNDRKSGEYGASWIEARIKCTGKDESYLDGKYAQDGTSYSEIESPIDGFEKKYLLTNDE